MVDDADNSAETRSDAEQEFTRGRPRSPGPRAEPPDQPAGAVPGPPPPSTVRGRYGLAVGLALLIVAFDRLTKEWAETALADEPMEIVPGVLSFSFAENFGASFSMFQGAGPILAVAAVVAAGVIIAVLRTAERRIEVVALGLIMGGAIGNLVDRVIRADGFLDGGVIDFIEFPNFPNFNVADSAITIGAVLLIWSAIRRSE